MRKIVYLILATLLISGCSWTELTIKNKTTFDNLEICIWECKESIEYPTEETCIILNNNQSFVFTTNYNKVVLLSHHGNEEGTTDYNLKKSLYFEFSLFSKNKYIIAFRYEDIIVYKN